MVLVEPLLELGVVALVLWAVATALAIALIMRYIADVFRVIPGVGGTIADGLDFAAQAISNGCGKLEHGVDKLIGASWHMLARYMDHLWNHLVWSSHVLLQSAEELARLAYSHLAIKAAVHSLVKTWHGIEHGVKDLQKEALHTQHRVKVIERTIARGIGHDLRIHVKALEREVARVRHVDIPGLRVGLKAAEGEVTDLRNFIRAIPGTRYLEWAAGIVASVLSIEILNLLRCPQGKNMANQRGCSMWGALDDLLGLLALGIVAADFEELVHEAQGLTDVATSVFDDVFGLKRPPPPK